MDNNNYSVVSTIGKLIRYYRKTLLEETGDSIYTQKGIVSHKSETYINKLIELGERIDKKLICSNKTLVAIETGTLITEESESTFIGLAMNINKKYSISRTYIYYFNDIYEQTIKNIEWMNRTNLKTILTSLNEAAPKMKNLLLYNELQEIFKAFILYYLDNEIPNKDFIIKYSKVADAFNIDIQSLIYTLILVYYKYIEIDHALYNNYLCKINSFNLDNIIGLKSKLFYHATTDQQYELIQLLKDIEDRPDYKDNYYLQYYVNDFRALMMINTNFDKADEPLKNCISLMKKHQNIFNYSHKASSYLHFGVYSFHKKDYENAIKYFEQTLKYKNYRYPIGLLISLIYSLERLNKPNNIIKKTIEDLNINPKQHIGLFKSVLYYYKLKYKQEIITKNIAITLEDIITEDILPNLHEKSINRGIFINELKDLLQISKRFKPLTSINSFVI
jgi:hypothetical protein